MFKDYIGQDIIKNNLTVLINYSKENKMPLPHMLITGFSGGGKTTLVDNIAKAYEVKQITLMGAHVEYNDIVNAITQLNDRDILFIDEIHSLNSKIVIKLYSLLADAELHYTLQGQPLVLQIPKITIIGATTHSGKLPEALRNRFPTTFNLKEYTENDLKSMLDLYAKEFAYESIAIKERIVTMSRNVPRTLKNLVQNIRVYATCMKTNTITNTIVDRVSAALSIDNLGLTDVDIALLKALSQTRPKSLKTLSNILNVEIINIERIYEPYLLKLGFIEIVTKGRVITEKGANYIKTPGE